MGATGGDLARLRHRAKPARNGAVRMSAVSTVLAAAPTPDPARVRGRSRVRGSPVEVSRVERARVPRQPAAELVSDRYGKERRRPKRPGPHDEARAGAPREVANAELTAPSVAPAGKPSLAGASVQHRTSVVTTRRDRDEAAHGDARLAATLEVTGAPHPASTVDAATIAQLPERALAEASDVAVHRQRDVARGRRQRAGEAISDADAPVRIVDLAAEARATGAASARVVRAARARADSALTPARTGRARTTSATARVSVATAATNAAFDATEATRPADAGALAPCARPLARDTPFEGSVAMLALTARAFDRAPAVVVVRAVDVAAIRLPVAVFVPSDAALLRPQ